MYPCASKFLLNFFFKIDGSYRINHHVHLHTPCRSFVKSGNNCSAGLVTVKNIGLKMKHLLRIPDHVNQHLKIIGSAEHKIYFISFYVTFHKGQGSFKDIIKIFSWLNLLHLQQKTKTS